MLRERLAATPTEGNWTDHFRGLAAALLHTLELDIGGQPHQLCEVEFYLDVEGHRDPFTHRSEAQRGAGRWYFHRIAGSYRGGSFKGLDISFGPKDSYGGILIRSLRRPDGSIVNGCSLCVDHMLAVTQATSVAALDERIAGRPVDDPTSPLALIARAEASEDNPTISATARVGLTLKRVLEHPTMPAYIARPYRFLTDPRAIKKGRMQLIIALHRAGLDTDEIRRRCGSPRKTIERYVEAFEDGRDSEASESALGTLGLCRLYGQLSGATA